MPYLTTVEKIDAEIVLSRKGVTIYHTHPDDDVEQMKSRFHFVCANADSDHESSFDIRDLEYPPSGPNLNDHPPFIGHEAMTAQGFTDRVEWMQSDYYLDTHEKWDHWHDSGHDAAIQNHLTHLIDTGHFDKWREQEEAEYNVRAWVTMRAMAQTTIMAANDESAVEIAGRMKPDDFCFSWFKTDDMSIEGDETFHVLEADPENDDDPIEIDMRRPSEPFSWDAVRFVKKLATLTTPEDEFNNPDFDHQDQYDSVEEYIADMSDERLTGEYAAFMPLIREARSLLKKPTA